MPSSRAAPRMPNARSASGRRGRASTSCCSGCTSTRSTCRIATRSRTSSARASSPIVSLASVVRFHSYAPQLFGMLPMLLAEAAGGQFGEPHGPVAHAGAVDRRTDLRAVAVVRHVRGGRAGDAGRSGRRRDHPRHGIRRLHAGAMRGVAAWHGAAGFPRRSEIRQASAAAVRRAGSGDAAAVRRRGAAHAAEFAAFRFPRTGSQRDGRGLRAAARRRVHRCGRTRRRSMAGCLEQLQYSPPFGGSYGWDP